MFLHMRTHFMCRELPDNADIVWAQRDTQSTARPAALLHTPVRTAQGLFALLIPPEELIN